MQIGGLGSVVPDPDSEIRPGLRIAPASATPIATTMAPTTPWARPSGCAAAGRRGVAASLSLKPRRPGGTFQGRGVPGCARMPPPSITTMTDPSSCPRALPRRQSPGRIRAHGRRWFCVAARSSLVLLWRPRSSPARAWRPWSSRSGACRTWTEDALRERRVAEEACNGGAAGDDGRRSRMSRRLRVLLRGSVARSEHRTTARSAIGHSSYYPGSCDNDARGDPHQ